jgi:hypothetical protein
MKREKKPEKENAKQMRSGGHTNVPGVIRYYRLLGA